MPCLGFSDNFPFFFFFVCKIWHISPILYSIQTDLNNQLAELEEAQLAIDSKRPGTSHSAAFNDGTESEEGEGGGGRGGVSGVAYEEFIV